MTDVVLTIGGREFSVSCAPGEEAHVTGLGRMIDKRVRQLGEPDGRLSEARMLLFAALLLADDLHEAKTQAAKAQAAAATPDPALETAAHQIDAVAAHLEKLAAALEESATSA